MPDRYALPTRCRESRGIVTLYDDRISVSAPNDYTTFRWFKDPTTRAGYVHSFLRPFRAVMAGFIPQPGFIVYPFVDAAPLDGLRCPGAVSVYRNPGGGFTLVFFPAMQKAAPDQAEVDHLTGHVDLDQGVIRIGEMHAKVRLAGQDLPTENLTVEGEKDPARPFGFVNRDDHHVAFECWSRDVRYWDPAGSIESVVLWSSTRVRENRKPQLRATIEGSVPKTIACPAPTRDGLVLVGSPLLARVGLLTEKGIKMKGGTDAALSQPHGAALGLGGLRLHRYRDIRGIDPSWPEGVSLFVEIGLLKTNPPNDHNLPDVRESLFQQLIQAP